MGVLQTHMAKVYYAQRLPEESIQKLKVLAENRKVRPAKAMEHLIDEAWAKESPFRTSAPSIKTKPGGKIL